MQDNEEGDEAYRALVAKKNKEVFPSENNPNNSKKPVHPRELGSLLELLLDAAKVLKQKLCHITLVNGCLQRVPNLAIYNGPRRTCANGAQM
jgi:hypothetical protein